MAKKTRNVSNHHSSGSKHSKDHARPGEKSPEKATINVKHVVVTAALFLAAGVAHYAHTTYMFESDKHFSHLSNLERELSFRTEMGLYYSYYKTLIEAPSFVKGIQMITNDNVTEYPNVINTLQRFNLYPELVTAFLYRNYRTVTDMLKIPTVVCYTVNRGDGFSPVPSCEGSGDPMYFYVGVVYLLNGVMMGVFYLFGATLSESPLGGIMAVAAYFMNHGECTRVQWTPALRESFAQPFLILQMWITSSILRRKRSSTCLTVLNAVTSIVFILFWQFAPFALTTQIIAVTAVYVIDLISRDLFLSFIKGQALALLISYCCLFGNRMLICSLMTSSLIAAFLLANTEQILRRIPYKILRWIVCMCHFLLMTLCIKIMITKLMNVDEDAHIVDLLRSKFTEFSTFHTKLYTCAIEFDFLPMSTFVLLARTLLLPAALLAVLIVIYRLIKYALLSGAPIDPAIVYNVLQLFAFAVMAVLIMRLKLFWTPQLCLVAALLASKRVFPLKNDLVRHAFVGLLLSGMCVQGWSNLGNQWAIKGEFSNPTMEELIEWVNATSRPDSVFAGSMPTMATIKLTTKRPIVNHPHYEDAGLRARTKKVYAMFSRKPLREVYEYLVELKVDYVIVEKVWCIGRSGTGCTLAEIWDAEDPEYADRKPACIEMADNPKPYFTPLKGNDMFKLFKVNKFPNKK